MRRAAAAAVAILLACAPDKRPAPTAGIDSLLARAESVYANHDYDAARQVFDSALALATQRSDTTAEAHALTGMGLAAWHRGQYDDARSFGERALALKRRANLIDDLFKSYNALGLLAHNQGRLHDALQYFDHAEEAARNVGDSAGVAKAKGNRGLVYSDIADFPRAREGIDAMRRASHAAGDAALEGNALTNLGMIEIRAGNPRDALRILKDALALQRSSENVVGEENALGQLGTAYDAIGEPQRAFAYLDSALVIARRHGLRQQETDDLQLIAGLHDESGDHSRALEYLARAMPLADSLGMRNIQGAIARTQARTLLALGNGGQALSRAEAARRFHVDAGASLEELEDELLIAELHQRAGAGRLAAVALDTARRLAMHLGSRVARAELALGEAQVADVAADGNGVLRAIPRGQRDLAAATTGRAWEADALRARAYARLGRLDLAAAAGRDAMRAVERVRRGFGSGMQRTTFITARASVYSDLVVTLLRMGRTDEAFIVADAARGRALLEHVAAARQEIGSKPGGGADVVRAEELLRRIDELIERLRVADTASPRQRGMPADTQVGFLSEELATARRDYERLMQQTAVGDGPLAAFVVDDRRDETAARVKTALRPGEAMLEYFVSSARLVIFVVTPAAVRSIAVPVGEDALFTRVRLARDLLTRPDASAESRDAVLRGLYDVLIEPARRARLLEDAKTLVIVPHASLAYVPFAALIDRAGGHYLVEQYALLLAPSAASLATVRAEPNHALLSEARVFAPFPDELPGTRDEVAVAKHVLGTAAVYVGKEATERALRGALASPGMVHVATHGVMNLRSPMFSRLELARPSGENAPFDNDGRLEVHELLGLTIRTPLVFLSGCETGAGGAWSTSFARGEDYATLAEAFLFAGARNVVSTLWRIEDRSAAVFAAAFYKEIGHVGPVEALARAQRTFLRDKPYGAPYYWAAYTLSGDGSLGAQNSAAAAVQ